MGDTAAKADAQIEQLAARVERLESRLIALENQLRTGSGVPAGDSAPAMPEPSAAPTDASTDAPPASHVGTALVGRLLVVLGGAYILRALTEGDVVSRQSGIALGLTYAALWLPAALRAARRQQPMDAAFHAAACVLVAFPLIWETTARFGTLSPELGALAIVLLCAAGLAVAARARLPLIDWLFVLGGTICGVALAFRRAEFAPAALALMLIGMLAILPARRRGFVGPAWCAATGAAAGALRVLFEAIQRDPVDMTPEVGIGMLLWYFVGYLGITVTRTLVRRRHLSLLEAIQTGIALLIGYGGAMLVSRMRDALAMPLGVATLLLAALIYAAAFTLLDRARRHTFVYLTTLAFVLVVGGCAVLLAAPEVPWMILAIITAVLGRRYDRLILSHQAAFYATAAGVASGLVETAGAGWLGAVTDAWAPIPGTAWAALAVLVVCALLPARRTSAYRAPLSFLPQLVAITVAAWSLGGIVLTLVQPILPADDAGLLATVRMLVLVAFSLGLLATSRHPRFASCRLLLGPMLAAGALKLVLEDLAVGRPLTLAFSFALYGVLLMLGPKLARTAAGEPEAAA